MAITFDTTTGIGSGTGITGSQSWNHTAAASLVGGAGVVIVGGGVEETTGVTYGGGAMTRIATGVNASGESGSCSVWWIANDDPGWPGNGTQQVSITRTGSTAYIAQAVSVLVASGNSADPLSPTQNIGWDIGSSLSISTITTSLTIPNGVSVFLYGGLYSGENALSSITDNASLTRINSADFGNFTGIIDRRTAIYTGTGAALTTFAWTQSSDDGAWAVVAINENIGITVQQGSLTANAVIRKTITPTAPTADAVVRREMPGSATADSIISRARTFDPAITLDAITLRTTTPALTLSADAVVYGTVESSATADAVVRKTDLPGSAVVDATISRTSDEKTVVADAIASRTMPGEGSSDAVIWRTQAGSLTADSIVKAEITGSFSMDAAIAVRVFHDTFTRSGALGGSTADSGQRYTDPYAPAPAQPTIIPGSTDGSVATFTSDASTSIDNRYASIPAIPHGVVRFRFRLNTNTIYRMFTVYVPGGQVSGGVTGGEAYVVGSGGNASVALALGEWYAVEYRIADGEEWFSITRESNGSTSSQHKFAYGETLHEIGFYANANAGSIDVDDLEIWTSGDITPFAYATADAIISRPQEGGASADAYVAPWFTAGAWISGGDQHFHADAVVAKAQSSATPLDAVVQRTAAASLAASAVVRRVQTGTLAADAVIKRNQSGSKTVDAVRKKTWWFGPVESGF